MMDTHISKGFGPAMRRVYKDNFDDTHHTLIVSLKSQSQNENCPLAAITFQKESGCQASGFHFDKKILILLGYF